ncbi:MAG: efflux transporter outer membrane subunit [Phycisphaerales bacterium]
MRKCLSAAAAMLILLSSCMVGPDYQRPQVETPGTFRADPTTVPDAESIADLKWFEVYSDEHLQDLIQTALVQNYDLRVAVARVDAARANLGITQSYQYPTFGVGGGFTNVQFSRNGLVNIPSGNRQADFGSVFLSLFPYEIDIWGRLRRATEASQAEMLATDWNRNAVVTTLVSDVATAYFNLLELDMELAIAKDTLATREKSRRLIQLQQQAGLTLLVDLRQAGQLVYGAAQAIPSTEQQIQQTENQINLLLGKNPGPVARGRLLTEQQTPPSVPAGLPSSLLERRPDIQAAEQSLIAANANIGVAKAAYFPRISLTGDFGFSSASLGNLFSGASMLWSFVPQVSQPIFTAGRIKSGVQLAEAQQRSALAEYEHAIQSAFRDVSDALIAYRKVREVRAQRELLVTALRDRKRLAYRSFEAGLDTMLNALNADQDLFTAELSLAQARLDELLSLVQLYKALGGGWQMEEAGVEHEKEEQHRNA